MLNRFRPRVTYANVASTLALFLALTTGTVYAANEWTGKNIKNGTLTGADVKNSSLTGSDIKGRAGSSTTAAVNGSITTYDIAGQEANPGNGTPFVDGTITGWDVKDDSLKSADIAPLNGDSDILDNTITTFDLADNSVDSDEVLDFGLSNEDIGVLFAQVNGDGTVAGSSGGVTVIHLATGAYEVDFARDISACAFVATQGEAGYGGAAGAIIGVTDRSGNAEAVFVSVRTDAGASIDRAFQLVVVC